HDLAGGLDLGATGVAAEDAAVLERQDRGLVVRHDEAPAVAGGAPDATSSGSSACVMRPPQTVSMTGPWSVAPANGVLRPWVWKRVGSTVHSASGSNRTKSAGVPGSSVTGGKSKRRRGASVHSSIARSSVMW